jgi:sugar/nucleoside kinase (ribokinase family)
MADQVLDVVGIGNAIVDVLSHADEAFLAAAGLTKGSMTLIDAVRAEQLYAAMASAVECSGGAAANTVAGVASLGGKAGFIGKVKADQLGQIFRHDIRAIGVAFDTAAAADGPSTARCLVLVTPDAQRTMGTYLGACVELTADDIDEALLARTRVTYLEGYLWDPPAAKQAFLKAMRAAHAAGGKVALSLSDSFCVERYREEFRQLVDNHVDVLFANENEIKALYQVDDFEAAAAAVRGRCEVAALTRSEKGSLILAGDDSHAVAAAPVQQVVDSTGAGDLYAAGFLYGYTRGRHPGDCGRLGAIAAAEVISHLGARPETSLAELARGALG